MALHHGPAVRFLSDGVDQSPLPKASWCCICSLPPMVYVLYYTKSRGGIIGFLRHVSGVFVDDNKKHLIRIVMGVLLLSSIALFGPECRVRQL